MLRPSLNGILNLSFVPCSTLQKTVCIFLTEQQFCPDLLQISGQKTQTVSVNITAFVSNTVNFKVNNNQHQQH